MCTGNEQEHDACRELLGYCPYCEESIAYPAAPTPSLEMPMEIVNLSNDTLVINGQ